MGDASNPADSARGLPRRSGSVDEASVQQCQELQHLLQMAHEENKDLRRQVEEQQEEISLLEGNVLGALKDIRDDDSTGRRWAGARRPQQRSTSQPTKLTSASASPAPNDRRSTPPRKPGDIRRVLPQARGGDRGSSGFMQISSA